MDSERSLSLWIFSVVAQERSVFFDTKFLWSLGPAPGANAEVEARSIHKIIPEKFPVELVMLIMIWVWEAYFEALNLEHFFLLLQFNASEPAAEKVQGHAKDTMHRASAWNVLRSSALFSVCADENRSEICKPQAHGAWDLRLLGISPRKKRAFNGQGTCHPHAIFRQKWRRIFWI